MQHFSTSLSLRTLLVGADWPEGTRHENSKEDIGQ